MLAKRSMCHRIAFMSTFPPRECGLATFTEDLMNAVTPHGAQCGVIAMTREGHAHQYDSRVIATVREDCEREYIHAAMQLNDADYDVLSVQHEYGIYGGESCDHLMAFLDTVDLPVITTLHTVLRQPSDAQKRSLRSVAERSDALMVMNGLAIDILHQVYRIDRKKVHMIHHGAPPMVREEKDACKARLQLARRKVITTFGLLSAGKGIEVAIQAMPRIVERHPDLCYFILGQTHPVVKQQEGEGYRERLQAMVGEFGLQQHVRFVDQYLSKADIVEYLKATDIYLTPYLNMEQVTSGTLAYAVACGCASVSTPYLHAQFLLSDERGILIPPRDPDAMASACLRILDDPKLQLRMEAKNRMYGQTMLWPHVGSEFLQLCAQVIHQQQTILHPLLSNV